MSFTIEKKLSLCLAIVMLLSMLTGCHEDVETASGTPSIDFESQAHIQVGTSNDDASTPAEESQSPLTGDFVVNLKKYDYNGNNIELLHVENKTNNHYNVTIKGKYLDKDGKVIKEETQKFAAFPAGWSNYFIFYPRSAFDSFTYELKTEAYTREAPYSLNSERTVLTTDSDGNPLASYLSVAYEKEMRWGRHVITYTSTDVEGRGMFFYLDVRNNHPAVTIGARYHVLVLDAEGNVYLTDYDYFDLCGGGAQNISQTTANDIKIGAFLTAQPVGEDETIPDNVQGVFTAIFAITDVYDDENF